MTVKKRPPVYRVSIGDLVFEFDNYNTAASFSEIAYNYILNDVEIVINLK